MHHRNKLDWDTVNCRRNVIAVFWTLTATILSSFNGSASAARNVVFMISDNQRWFDVGCYGNTVVQTLNIDRPAAEVSSVQSRVMQIVFNPTTYRLSDELTR